MNTIKQPDRVGSAATTEPLTTTLTLPPAILTVIEVAIQGKPAN